MSLDNIIATGTYTGTAVLLAVDLGWQPALVIISSRRTAGTAAQRCLAFKTASMAAAGHVQCSSSASYGLLNGITLTATGFSVGISTPINSAGFTYDYFAVRAGEWMDTGSFVGTDPTSFTTVTLGRQASFIFLAGASGTIQQFVKCDQESTRECTGFAADVLLYPAAGTQGITLGTTSFRAEGAGPNGGGVTEHWAALYQLVGGNRHFESGVYTGDGTSQTITLGRQPKWLFIVARTPTPAGWAFKTDGMAANAEGRLVTQYDWATTAGATITTTGFTTGTANSVSGKSYYWIAGFY